MKYYPALLFIFFVALIGCRKNQPPKDSTKNVVFCREVDSSGCQPPLAKTKLRFRLPAPARNVTPTIYLNSVFPLNYRVCAQVRASEKSTTSMKWALVLEQHPAELQPVESKEIGLTKSELLVGCVPLTDILEAYLPDDEPIDFINPIQVRFFVFRDGKQAGFRTVTIETQWFYP